MRWGVPEEAADDHSAATLCLQEIKNCQRLSTGPNFVVIIVLYTHSRALLVESFETTISIPTDSSKLLCFYPFLK